MNKSNTDTIQLWTDVIREEIPNADVCAHYSLKYNKCRKKDGAFLLLNDFVKDMQRSGVCYDDVGNVDTDADVNDDGNGMGDEHERECAKNEVLLITGSGPKGKFDSVTALKRLKVKQAFLQLPLKNTNTKGYHKEHLTMAAAFNPFFPSLQDLEAEKKRLVQKLDTGQVQKVYLQFGTDLQRLRSALDWLKELNSIHPSFDICGSIFLPTKKLIAQQKFRPWNGVFLSGEFLASEEGARGIVLYMMRLYEEYGCEILVEAPGVRSDKDMKLVEQLLAERDMERDTGGDRDDNGKNDDVASLSSSSAPSKKRRIDMLAPSQHIAKEMLQKPAIVLFGSHDIRLHDNIAFQQASFHSSVIPVFLWSRKEQGSWGVTGALEVVLKEALMNLDRKLHDYNSRLITRMAEHSSEELLKLCQECGVGTVYLNKEHTTESRVREQRQKDVLRKYEVDLVECQSSLLYDPMDLSLAAGFNGGHWGTLMPFLKGCKKQLGEPRRPIQKVETLSLLEGFKSPKSWPNSTPLNNLALAIIKGDTKWDIPIRERFPMSEEHASSNLNSFFSNGFHWYETERSRADIEWSTSKLSAHLRLGTLSPNELYYKVEDSGLGYEDKKTFSRRLYWRDLAYFQLLNFPDMRYHSIRRHYDKTEWVNGEEEDKRFNAWKKGKTGYPLVDAGMRELYATGWMTQSVRMIVASFLTEYLRVNWVKGCEWFHYTLVDADSAINAMMWQNAGRSGIDQWNFVMSPVAASQDGTGSYTRKWIPELTKLKKPLLHKPWDAPKEILEEAGVVLGETYPHRIVTDLKGEKEISDNNVLAMRGNHQECNNDRGYDLIKIGDRKTVVFTKKQFRIDREGNVMNTGSTKKSRKKSDRSKRGARGYTRNASS